MPKPQADIWRIEITVPLHAVEAFEPVMDRYADAVSWFMDNPDEDETDGRGKWRLEGFSRTPVDRVALETALELTSAALGCEPPEARIEQVEDHDWVLASLRSFPPISAGRFYVHGSHMEGKPPAGTIGLKIDAGAAFGSGEHATTNGCLRAIDRLLRQRSFRKPLDLGCGSGILAIAIAKASGVPVLAADIDPVSVQVAHDNARRNGVPDRVTTRLSEGYRSRAVTHRAPYDLVVANILARPLAKMARDTKRFLAPGGILVLSGLLNRQERFVLSAHRIQGLSLVGRFRINGWSTLILGRTPRTRA